MWPLPIYRGSRQATPAAQRAKPVLLIFRDNPVARRKKTVL
jgi:hypothetical protein